MFVIDLVANLRELYLRNYDVRTDLYMKLHTELGRLWFDKSDSVIYIMIFDSLTARTTC